MSSRASLNALNARLVPLPAMRRSDRAARLLAELRHGHDALLDALSLKETVISASSPVSTRFSLARWQLGRARHVRQRILNDVYGELFQTTTEQESALLRMLQADELELCQRSSDHLAHWTNQRVEAEWLGYRAAAAEMIKRVRRRVMVERELIYPMLIARTGIPAHLPCAAEILEPCASSAVS
jgi:hypothetical protein